MTGPPVCAHASLREIRKKHEDSYVHAESQKENQETHGQTGNSATHRTLRTPDLVKKGLCHTSVCTQSARSDMAPPKPYPDKGNRILFLRKTDISQQTYHQIANRLFSRRATALSQATQQHCEPMLRTAVTTTETPLHSGMATCMFISRFLPF